MTMKAWRTACLWRHEMLQQEQLPIHYSDNLMNCVYNYGQNYTSHSDNVVIVCFQFYCHVLME